MRFNHTLFNEVGALVYKEVLTEWRQRYALNGLILYVFIIVFVVALVFHNTLPVQVWNTLFWIIHLFVGVNAIAKSFLGESEGQMLYLYQLAGARAVILAKMIYNSLLMLVCAAITVLFYCFLLGNPVQAFGYFALVVGLGSLSVAGTFTIVAAIVAGAGNKTTLMAVMGFPALIPQMLLLIRLSQGAVDGFMRWGDLSMMGVMIGMIVILSILLFPYIWRE